MVYNPGGQLGKSVQGGGQRPAKQPGGPFLGKGAKSGKSKRRPEKESKTTPRIKSDNATSRRCIGSVIRRQLAGSAIFRCEDGERAQR